MRIKTLGILAAFLAGHAFAQSYPEKPITWGSAMAVGGSTDLLARDLGQLVSKRLGQAVVVEPMPGAGGGIAVQKVVGSRPDGYTFLFSSNSVIANQVMKKNPDFDLRKNLLAVSALFEGPTGIYINPAVPAKTVQEFIAYLKSNPGKLNYGSSGTGSILHLVAEQFKHVTGTDIVHVPYKGGNPAFLDTISNQVQLVFSDTQPAYLKAAEAGRVRLLAVSARQRLPSMPDVPTVAESGLPSFNPTFWFALYAPVGTPSSTINRVSAELQAILTSADGRQRFADKGYTASWMSPEATQKRVADEIGVYANVIGAARIERD